MSHKFDSLFWVYDAGFRWGPPDLTYPPPYASCVSKPIDLLTVKPWHVPTCEVPGCYVCKRDRDGNLYPRFP